MLSAGPPKARFSFVTAVTGAGVAAADLTWVGVTRACRSTGRGAAATLIGCEGGSWTSATTMCAGAELTSGSASAMGERESGTVAGVAGRRKSSVTRGASTAGIGQNT